MKITKKIFTKFFLIITIPIVSYIAVSCSSFDQKLRDKKLELKMNRDKIASEYREGYNDFTSFINNTNTAPFSTLNSYYFNISKEAKTLSQVYDMFKKEVIKLKDNDIIKKLITEEFNDFKPVDLNDLNTLNIDVWMTKLSVINNDLQAIVESRRRDWDNTSNIYKTIYNLELNPEDNTFLNDNTELIKSTTQRHVDQAIIRLENQNTRTDQKPFYQTMWFDRNFSINYNNINVLVNNPDTQTDQKIINFWHTHALGNIFNEWANVVIDNMQNVNNNSNSTSDVSINAVDKLNDFLNKIKNQYDGFKNVNNKELSLAYNNLVLAHQKLIDEINQIKSKNNNIFPLKNFLNFFDDQTNNAYNTGPFGKMNRALEQLYKLSKTL